MQTDQYKNKKKTNTKNKHVKQTEKNDAKQRTKHK